MAQFQWRKLNTNRHFCRSRSAYVVNLNLAPSTSTNLSYHGFYCQSLWGKLNLRVQPVSVIASASASLSGRRGTGIGIGVPSCGVCASAIRTMHNHTSNHSSSTSTRTSTVNKISTLFLQSSVDSERVSTAGISNNRTGISTSVAAVALILRLNVNYIRQSQSNEDRFADLPLYFNDVDHLQSWCQAKALGPYPDSCILPLDILLIKRQVHPGDPWSGDIALPGGHIEANETALLAAIRETHEEIGLDLANRKYFQHVGELNVRKAKRGRKNLLVYPQIFFYLGGSMVPDSLCPSTPITTIANHTNAELKMTLNMSEVMDAWWINLLPTVAAQQRQAHSFSLDELSVAKSITSRPDIQRVFDDALKWFNMTRIHFPGYHLPVRSLEQLPYPTQRDWVLWGMTYGVVNELIRVMNEHGFIPTAHQSHSNTNQSAASDPSETVMRQCVELGFAFDNQWANSYLIAVKRVLLRVLGKDAAGYRTILVSSTVSFTAFVVALPVAVGIATAYYL